jgi:phosphoenolpyruvate synthase/pyruvate phosphate dikinase
MLVAVPVSSRNTKQLASIKRCHTRKRQRSWVQAMVFGNMGETSATGVAFTRNPSTGESALYSEFLINAQGEDVVAGIRTPQDYIKSNNLQNNVDKREILADDKLKAVFGARVMSACSR